MCVTRREVLGGSIAALFTPRAFAADWPVKPVTWICPFAPGGGADAVSRVIGNEVGKRFGQQIIVENRPGASGLVGTRQIVAAAPNGYTVGMLSDIHSVNVALGQQLGYDEDKDFTYISQLISVPMGLYTNTKRPYLGSLESLIKYAKENPGKLTAASIGQATTHHLAIEWLKAVAGIDVVVASFRGIPDGIQALLMGDVDMMFMGSSVAADGYIAKGMMAQVAVATRARLSRSPGVPTFIEHGFSDFEVISWYGLVGPAQIPEPVLQRWHKELIAGMNDPDVRRRLEPTGVQISPSSPKECAELVKKTTEKYKKIVALSGAHGKSR